MLNIEEDGPYTKVVVHTIDQHDRQLSDVSSSLSLRRNSINVSGSIYGILPPPKLTIQREVACGFADHQTHSKCRRNFLISVTDLHKKCRNKARVSSKRRTER